MPQGLLRLSGNPVCDVGGAFGIVKPCAAIQHVESELDASRQAREVMALGRTRYKGTHARLVVDVEGARGTGKFRGSVIKRLAPVLGFPLP